jgi:SAM-dependent methyltransferase
MAHWYPQSGGSGRPTNGWYWGWALYVNRRGFAGAFKRGFLVLTVLLVLAVALSQSWLAWMALAFAGVGGVVLVHSVIGHALVYGSPSRRYFERMLSLGGVEKAARVADLHIGTWRHSYWLADLLPEARIVSIDCWDTDEEAVEGAVRELRELEMTPPPAPRIEPLVAKKYVLPLESSTVDAVVMGLGTHEIAPEAQAHLLREARRVVKPGGKVLFFEHAKNWQSFLIFGPGIGHWTEREEWVRRLGAIFTNVRSERTALAVDIFAADA